MVPVTHPDARRVNESFFNVWLWECQTNHRVFNFPVLARESASTEVNSTAHSEIEKFSAATTYERDLEKSKLPKPDKEDTT
jgi:hypothetical protein